LGEEFDRDPFLIFTLRGLTHEELFERLEQADGKGPAPAGQPATEPVGTAAEPIAGESLPTDPSLFWNGQALAEDPFGEVAAPPVAAALPRRLGGFPFWRGAQPFLTALEPVYSAATPRHSSCSSAQPRNPRCRLRQNRNPQEGSMETGARGAPR
jgi:uncharacterized Zn finger protein